MNHVAGGDKNTLMTCSEEQLALLQHTRSETGFTIAVVVIVNKLNLKVSEVSWKLKLHFCYTHCKWRCSLFSIARPSHSPTEHPRSKSVVVYLAQIHEIAEMDFGIIK